MNNRDLGEKVVVDQTIRDPQMTMDAAFVDAIEAALDEAEVRGAEQFEVAWRDTMSGAAGDIKLAYRDLMQSFVPSEWRELRAENDRLNAILDKVIEMDECGGCYGEGFLIIDQAWACVSCNATGHGPIARMVKEATP